MAATDPNKTAVLVIHGIGEQNPFETLDVFARTLWGILESGPTQSAPKGRHMMQPRDRWTEHYLRLLRVEAAGPAIDVHEYYWAYQMSEKITLPEIVDWLVKVSDGARKHYGVNETLRKQYEQMGVDVFDHTGQFKSKWYLRHIGWALRLLGFLQGLGFPRIPYLDVVMRALMRKATRLIVDYVGDVAIYTTMDVKSKHYEIRTKVLEESVALLTQLLEEYHQVLIVGHSLGSVIAFDTLNRINLEINTGTVPADRAGRIVGLVTFGSPLDKIAFFFREHTPDDQCIRRQILSHLHGFKSRDLNLQTDARSVENPIVCHLEHVRWLNFWDRQDPISGHLDFYQIPDDDNIQLDMQQPWGFAHLGYWAYRPMYDRIAREFFPDWVGAAAFRK